MKKHMKPGRKYIVITLDKPYIERAYKVLKQGQMKKGSEHWPEGDITYRHWRLMSFDGVQGIDYLLKDRYMLVNTDEPYAGEIIKIIEESGDTARIVKILQKVEKDFKLHIKNQTDKTIDICSGLNTEFTLSPDEEKTISVGDGDYFYIDQAIEAGG